VMKTNGELAPWRPFRDLERWARRFPNFFEDWSFSAREDYLPALESFVKNGNLIVRADVPGVESKDVDVSVVGNVLTIKGERKEEQEVKSEDYIRRESSYGSFERRMTLPEGANTEKITAISRTAWSKSRCRLPNKRKPRKSRFKSSRPTAKSKGRLGE